MKPLLWNGRKCRIVGRTHRGWPVLRFGSSPEYLAVPLEQLKHWNPGRCVESNTQAAPLITAERGG